MSIYRKIELAALFCLFSISIAIPAQVVRIKDIATVQGVRENQLVGIGVVTGLAGRGDSVNSTMTKNSVANLLSAFGLKVDAVDVRAKNAALVAVTATASSFALPGDRIDVKISSVGDASDISGGVLIQTNLRAANGRAYAVAQGIVATTSADSGIRTVGSIPNGAIVETPVGADFLDNEILILILNDPDFSSAAAVGAAVKNAFPDLETNALNAGLVEIRLSQEIRNDLVQFVSLVEQIEITPDAPARIVIDERSGVVVLGGNVRIAPVGISYQDRNIRVQPASIYDVSGEKTFMVEEGATVSDFVLILKELGIETDVLIDIIKLIDKAGALYGELSIE